jgi:ubiquinone/menaquinone biosynthesis C-methylase UbiE
MVDKNTHTYRVRRDKWKNAQEWERKHWLLQQKNLSKYGKNFIWQLLSYFGVKEKYRGDDRNHWWKEMFENYKCLPASVKNALEVGCGPYTNLRLIQSECKMKNVFLSDPLIKTYIDFKMTFVREMYKKNMAILDDHMLEELPFANEHFDLVVMINVLDHVQDAKKCIQNVIRVAKDGGYIVIGQDLSNEEDLSRQPEELAQGHPITLDKEYLEGFLNAKCEAVLKKMVPRELGWAPQWHYGTLVYIGRKFKKNSTS